MNNKLVTAEYMPPAFIRLQKIIKILTIILAGVIVWLFCVKIDSLAQKKQEYQQYEKIFSAYETFLADAETYQNLGDFEKSEGCYRSAIELLPKAQAPYLGLSQVFCEIKEYEAALQVLESYPGQQREEIDMAVGELKEQMEILQQSVLQSESQE